MKRFRTDPHLLRHSLYRGMAVAGLLAIFAMALAGPSGLLAWGDNQRLLETRRAELAQLTVQHDELKNRVNLLDPRHADTDLAGELLRSRLNVAHPDEVIMLLH